MEFKKMRRKGAEMVMRYVSNRIQGMNKTASARHAGYKQPNKITMQIEKSNNFKEITAQILANNSHNAILAIDAIRDDMKTKAFLELPVKDKVYILLSLSNIQKALSPDLRIKETIDDKGKVTRTMWNTASPMETVDAKALQNKDINPVSRNGYCATLESPLDTTDTTPVNGT